MKASIIKHSQARSLRSKGFSLVELLVVVSIIAVLTALAFPTYKRAVQMANSSKCYGNLRQIGTAAQLFANDNDGRLITWGGDGFSPYSARWHQALAPSFYHGDLSAQWTPAILNQVYTPLACPSVASQYGFGSGYKVTYAVNTFQIGYPVIKLAQISHPSTTIYLTDGYAFFYSPTDIMDAGYPPAGLRSGVYFPHQGKCNALFLDQHVESLEGSIPLQYIQL